MTKGKDETVTIRRESLLTAIRHLSMVVVSMDRIGSCISTMTLKEVNDLTILFIDDWDVIQKLALTRKLLSEPFSPELGDDDMEDIERELEGTPYWSYTARKPPE